LIASCALLLATNEKDFSTAPPLLLEEIYRLPGEVASPVSSRLMM